MEFVSAMELVGENPIRSRPKVLSKFNLMLKRRQDEAIAILIDDIPIKLLL